MRLGYSLMSEEHPPTDLLRYGRRAEELGFSLLTISDHYHPWISAQGQSPFVWPVIGGLAATTESAEIATFVTCPTVRIHPAIIAQAAATASSMAPGRFILGLGSGEALNEHVLGDHWPPAATRIEMLEEAIEVIRDLWTGEEVTFYGDYYTVEMAKLFTLPEQLPAVLVAATGPKAASLAAENEGLIAVSPDPDLVAQARDREGDGGPRKLAYGQLTVAWDTDMDAARRRARTFWPQSALGKGVSWEIPTTSVFDALVEGVSEDAAAKAMVTCTEAGPIIDALQSFQEAGFDAVSVHQVGGEQLQFLEFYAAEVMPKMAD